MGLCPIFHHCEHSGIVMFSFLGVSLPSYMSNLLSMPFLFTFYLFGRERTCGGQRARVTVISHPVDWTRHQVWRQVLPLSEPDCQYLQFFKKLFWWSFFFNYILHTLLCALKYSQMEISWSTVKSFFKPLKSAVVTGSFPCLLQLFPQSLQSGCPVDLTQVPHIWLGWAEL